MWELRNILDSVWKVLSLQLDNIGITTQFKVFCNLYL